MTENTSSQSNAGTGLPEHIEGTSSRKFLIQGFEDRLVGARFRRSGTRKRCLQRSVRASGSAVCDPLFRSSAAMFERFIFEVEFSRADMSQCDASGTTERLDHYLERVERKIREFSPEILGSRDPKARDELE